LPKSESAYILSFTVGAVADIKTIIPKHLKGLNAVRGNIYRRLERLARTGELAQGVLFSLRGFTGRDR
jgi:hypothetical protein